jgi:quercetin dioxygenase-like cupin family protein
MRQITEITGLRKFSQWFVATLMVGIAAMFVSPIFAADEHKVVRMNEIKWAPCDPNTPKDPCQINYFHGDPEKEPNHAYIRIPKGHLFPAHWHTSNTHVLAIKGTLVIGAEDDKNGTALKPGDSFYEPAKWIHWGKCTAAECVFYVFVDGPDSYIDVKDRRP